MLIELVDSLGPPGSRFHLLVFALLSVVLGICALAAVKAFMDSNRRLERRALIGVFLATGGLASFLAFSACSSLSNFVGGVRENPEVAELAVKYGTAKLIERTSVTPEQVFEVTDAIEIVATGSAGDDAGSTGSFALAALSERVPLDRLSPADRVLASALVDAVLSELGSRAADRGVEPGSVSVSDVRAVLSWVREGALLAEPVESGPAPPERPGAP